jgi:hypothetical protein
MTKIYNNSFKGEFADLAQTLERPLRMLSGGIDAQVAQVRQVEGRQPEALSPKK